MEDDSIAPTYPASVAQLLPLDESELGPEWLDYPALGLGPEHVPDLIRLATAEVPTWVDDESPEVWAPVHAWRALGQLQAVAAIPPLLARLTAEEDNDWLREDLPHVFARMGPAAIPPLVAYLANPAQTLSTRITAASGLAHIGMRHPEAREECVTALVRQLEAGEANDLTLNGFLVTDLVDLKAVEALPLIERGYTEDWVDDSIMGDFEDVEIALELKTTRTRPRHLRHHPGLPGMALLSGSEGSGRTRDEKAARKAKRKMAERSRRQNRRRKK